MSFINSAQKLELSNQFLKAFKDHDHAYISFDHWFCLVLFFLTPPWLYGFYRLFMPDASVAIWLVLFVLPNAPWLYGLSFCLLGTCYLFFSNTSEAIWLVLFCFLLPDACVAIWHVLFVRLMPAWLYGFFFRLFT